MNISEEAGAQSQFEHVVSPFAHAEAMMPLQRSSRSRSAWVVGAILSFMVAGSIGGWLTMRYLDDPLRTLETFPVAKYLDGYKALAGSRFKGSPPRRGRSRMEG